MRIRDRPKAGAWLGFALSVLFAGIMVPLTTFDLWTGPAVDASGRAVFTVRLPETSLWHDTLVGARIEHRRLVVARGEKIDPGDKRLIDAYEVGRRPPSLGLLLGLGIAYFMLGMLLTSYLRNFGYRGRRLRTQLTMLGCLIAAAALYKAYLLLTPFSAYWLPIGAFSISVAVHHDRQVAFAGTVALSFLVGSLIPFDLGLAMVLLLQGFGAIMFLSFPRKSFGLVAAGMGGGLLAGVGYLALYFLVRGRLPDEDTTSLVSSGIIGAVGGGVAAGVIALLVAPLFERALGEVPRGKLIELTDLNNPLLKRIAEKAPGTWAHSLAMANMAELAATAIGANALLTRVGAYYHDLGKSSAPQYYIENLHAGEPSPHDSLDPDVSADAIFAHCTEGVRLGRGAGIPEPVLDFMHMHHGNGLLEYFWHKNEQLGNPKRLSEKAFRYPGLPPQTKETGILAICDAVEAASRTLKSPSERDLSSLVQRIVFGKLRLGQLDQSGLTSSDLKALCNSLVDTLKSSFHVRIEYPWQKEERAAQKAADGQPATAAAAPASEAAAPASDAPPPVADAATSERPPSGEGPVEQASITQRILIEERLDSADEPRPRTIRKPAAKG
ncbi:MAG TPA: HDIG domain-containing protein [Polyangia bacterium]|nr:HDIG domain-containing protein [Polyangia bacterium]